MIVQMTLDGMVISEGMIIPMQGTTEEEIPSEKIIPKTQTTLGNYDPIKGDM
ncbi:MAG: hypothetical protein WC472_03835 [Candidatus Paceibacterota bacterium]